MDEKILTVIRENGEKYISGEEICKELGISRAAIWKHIEKLRHEGYDIAATPHLGYRFISAPDRLIPLEVSWKLKTKIFGKKIYSFKKTDSTNTIAYRLAENGEKEGSVVFAEQQTKGRGRFHRAWVSPQGGIYMSLILRPKLEPIKTALITLTASVAVAEAIREVTNLPARIKWPNDVLIDSSKISGILTEMKAEQDTIDFMILGIGVNVNSSKQELPSRATSIAAQSKTPISKVGLSKRILELLEVYYLKLNEDFESIINEWRGLSGTLGKRVKIRAHNQTLEGQALDVDENGGLIIRLDSGFTTHILSGDVELIR